MTKLQFLTYPYTCFPVFRVDACAQTSGLGICKINDLLLGLEHVQYGGRRKDFVVCDPALRVDVRKNGRLERHFPDAFRIANDELRPLGDSFIYKRFSVLEAGCRDGVASRREIRGGFL